MYEVGTHVWAHIKDLALNEEGTETFQYEEDVECVIQELGRNGNECMLRFAHPKDIPGGVRIGWRKYEDIKPFERSFDPRDKNGYWN